MLDATYDAVVAGVRKRLDVELVRRRLAASREQAQAYIGAGRVLVSGAVAEKASRLVGSDEPLVLTGDRPRFVGRGGEKLNSALAQFELDVKGRRVLDVGASTGGFTDCLLQRGAASVVAIDVGYGQLHERLRADPRVQSYERQHVRDSPFLLAERFSLVVGDLSFISLVTVAPSIAQLATPDGQAVLLVKPQFEAGRAEVSRGSGVIRDPLIRRRTVVAVVDAFAKVGGAMMGGMRSPILGADGNVEFLVHFAFGDVPPAPVPIDVMINAMIDPLPDLVTDAITQAELSASPGGSGAASS